VSGNKRVALVVDDEPDMCWILEYVLEHLGVRCIRTLDGESALRAARSNRLSLALLDAKLSDIDGLELARQIHAEYPGVPILLVSGYFYRDDPAVQAALEHKLIRGFIEKPFSHLELGEALKSALADDRPSSLTA
jgi:CheY-like chemotaxis protein